MTDETTQALLPCPPCPICRADATWETALTANVGGKEVIYGSCSECSCTAEYHDWLAHSLPSQADAGENIDPSKMSVEMAELFGLVCKLERLKTQRDDLMRTDGGFTVIERAADMMDEIVDSVPELKAVFVKVHAREAIYRAALTKGAE